jgi:hypothetical protein
MSTAVITNASTFSITGGRAQEFIDRGQMIPWSGVLVVEGGETGDRRYIEPGALTTRPLPMPFMVQLENPVGGDGHDGATLTGRIDTIDRQDDGQWFGTGFIDPTSGAKHGATPAGTELALALDKQMMRGVSVDLDQVSITEVQGKDGPRQVITAARIIGATATPFQAFVECEITLDADRMNTALAASADFAEWESEIEGHLSSVWTPTDGIETIVASAGSSIPVAPPGDWFERPTFTELTPLTVLANGRVFGHIAAWGTCHISFANRCQPVPRSNTNYAKFRCGSVLTAEGSMVRTGPIVMDTVHPDLRWKASDAQSFYADTGAAVCDVVPYEDKFGIAVVGAVRPDVTPTRLRAFRASDISPDWRTIDGHRYECCALLAVNNSGFKLPIALAASAGMYVEAGDTAIALDADDEVYALVASGPMRAEPCCDTCATHDAAVVADAWTDAVGSSTLDLADRSNRLAAIQTRFCVDRDSRMSALRTRFSVDRDSRLSALRTRFTPPPPPPPRMFRVASAEFAGPADEARDDQGQWTSGGAGSSPSFEDRLKTAHGLDLAEAARQRQTITSGQRETSVSTDPAGTKVIVHVATKNSTHVAGGSTTMTPDEARKVADHTVPKEPSPIPATFGGRRGDPGSLDIMRTGDGKIMVRTGNVGHSMTDTEFARFQDAVRKSVAPG